MSRPRAYSQDSLDIQERFFSALDFLRAEKKITNIQLYCVQYGIDPRSMHKQMNDRSRGFFQVGWLVPLVTYYHISAKWLLTGNGKMTTIHYK